MSQLLSRTDSVTATADVRGNLGPASVVIQKEPGADWIKDRWQAASNMHGTAIKGAHWVKLDFGRDIIVDKVVLDWEAAYANQYKLEGSNFDISDDDGADKWVMFDGTDPSQEYRRTSEESGQSPGVKTKTPLHVVHTIDGFSENKPIRYLRVFVYRSVMGWGGKFLCSWNEISSAASLSLFVIVQFHFGSLMSMGPMLMRKLMIDSIRNVVSRRLLGGTNIE